MFHTIMNLLHTETTNQKRALSMQFIIRYELLTHFSFCVVCFSSILFYRSCLAL